MAAELRLAARALPVEPGIGVGGALMSVVGAALAVEIAFAVASRYDRRAIHFLAAIQLASSIIWMR